MTQRLIMHKGRAPNIERRLLQFVLALEAVRSKGGDTITVVTPNGKWDGFIADACREMAEMHGMKVNVIAPRTAPPPKPSEKRVICITEAECQPPA